MIYLGFETVCPEKDRQTAFYSPLFHIICFIVLSKNKVFN